MASKRRFLLFSDAGATILEKILVVAIVTVFALVVFLASAMLKLSTKDISIPDAATEELAEKYRNSKPETTGSVEIQLGGVSIQGKVSTFSASDDTNISVFLLNAEGHN